MRSLQELLSKYIRSTEQAFSELKFLEDSVVIDRKKVNEIIDEARRYLEDAKYYRDNDQLETGIVSVVYSEGLLDALRLLGVVDFQWLSTN